MNLEQNQEQYQLHYQAGKDALERGEYALSVKHLEQASQLVAPTSFVGGEIQIWLVSAYQAAQMTTEAIALCKKLLSHPNLEIRQQSKQLLYIIEAPRLKRPKEWMSEIPDLTSLSESELESRRVGSGKTSLPSKAKEQSEPISVKTQDNQFIAVALVLLLIALGCFIWFNF